MYTGPKRKVFLAYYADDRAAVNDFVSKWATEEQIFTPKPLGTFDSDVQLNNATPAFVMGEIRSSYLQDSTVTLLLIGKCTHSRRYMDWIIKASLMKGADHMSNGLAAIALPVISRAFLPERFLAIYKEQGNGYPRFHGYPACAEQLIEMIETAHANRCRPDLLSGSREMMRYNQTCQSCGVVHAAG